jgi:hypothetical protein
VAERLKAAVLKTVRPERVSWVRIPPPPPYICCVRSGDILYRSFRGHSLHPWTKRIVQGLQSLLLKIDITEIIVHKADQPDTLVDFFDAHSLTCERSAEIDFLSENADPSAARNQNRPIVERIGDFSDAPILPRGSLIDWR